MFGRKNSVFYFLSLKFNGFRMRFRYAGDRIRGTGSSLRLSRRSGILNRGYL
jgi:hypothetical protein